MLLCERRRWGASGSSTGGPLVGGSGRGQVVVPSLPWASCTTEAPPAGSGGGSASGSLLAIPGAGGTAVHAAQRQAVLPVTKGSVRGRQATRRALRLSPPKPGPVARFSREEPGAQTPAGRRLLRCGNATGPWRLGAAPAPTHSVHKHRPLPAPTEHGPDQSSRSAKSLLLGCVRSRLREGGCVRGLGPATHPGPPSAVAAHLCPCSAPAHGAHYGQHFLDPLRAVRGVTLPTPEQSGRGGSGPLSPGPGG